MGAVEPFVNEARLEMHDDDVRRPGAVVTTELCGHWDHDGSCRWPHHTSATPDPAATAAAGVPVVVARTVFAADPTEADALSVRINQALARDDGWRLVSWGLVEPSDDERRLAAGWH